MDSFSFSFCHKKPKTLVFTVMRRPFMGLKPIFLNITYIIHDCHFVYFLLLNGICPCFFKPFFLHRYAAHKAFTMNRFTEKVFFVLTWLFQGPNYLSPFGYGTMHRMHHAFADTENDPHSPKYDETIWNMMWKTKNDLLCHCQQKIDPESRFTDGVPQWESFDKFARSWPSRLAWAALYFSVYWQLPMYGGFGYVAPSIPDESHP